MNSDDYDPLNDKNLTNISSSIDAEGRRVVNEIKIFSADATSYDGIPIAKFKFDEDADWGNWQHSFESTEISLDRDVFSDSDRVQIVGLINTPYYDKENVHKVHTSYFPLEVDIRAIDSHVKDFDIVNANHPISIADSGDKKMFLDLTEGENYALKITVDKPSEVEAVNAKLYIDGAFVASSGFTRESNPVVPFTAEIGDHDMEIVLDSCVDFRDEDERPFCVPHRITYDTSEYGFYETRARDSELTEMNYYRFYEGKYDEREKSTILHPSQKLAGSFILVDEWNRPSEGTTSTDWFKVSINGVQKTDKLTYKGNGLYEWEITDWEAPSDYTSYDLRITTTSDVLPLGGYPEDTYYQTIKVQKCYTSCDSCCGEQPIYQVGGGISAN